MSEQSNDSTAPSHPAARSSTTIAAATIKAAASGERRRHASGNRERDGARDAERRRTAAHQRPGEDHRQLQGEQAKRERNVCTWQPGPGAADSHRASVIAPTGGRRPPLG